MPSHSRPSATLRMSTSFESIGAPAWLAASVSLPASMAMATADSLAVPFRKPRRPGTMTLFISAPWLAYAQVRMRPDTARPEVRIRPEGQAKQSASGFAPDAYMTLRPVLARAHRAFRSRFRFGQRQDHRHLAPVLLEAAAVRGGEVALLEEDADEDVSRGRDREQQVAHGHGGRRPEGDQEAEHDRMAHEVVEPARDERHLGVVGAAHAQPDLAQPEQVEVVDHEGRQQDDGPAEGEQRMEGHPSHGILDFPDHAWYRTPLPEQQRQD